MQESDYGYAIKCNCGASGPEIDEDEEPENVIRLSREAWNKRL
jgi:hypothetical protein